MLPATEQAPFKDATRILSSVLASAERRVLRYLALRMPRAVNSDHLTALALVAMAGAGVSYWISSVTPVGLWLATVFLALNWFGDSLDGTLARVRQHQRPRYGYYVDHVVDAAGAMFLFGGLALSGYMHPLVAMGLLVAYFVLSIEMYLAAHVLGEFRITYFQMGPTELRILLAIGSLWLMVKPNRDAVRPHLSPVRRRWHCRHYRARGHAARHGHPPHAHALQARTDPEVAL